MLVNDRKSAFCSITYECSGVMEAGGSDIPASVVKACLNTTGDSLCTALQYS